MQAKLQERGTRVGIGALLRPPRLHTGGPAPRSGGAPVDRAARRRKYRTTHHDRRYAVAKRMLNHLELRRHGIQNPSPKD